MIFTEDYDKKIILTIILGCIVSIGLGLAVEHHRAEEKAKIVKPDEIKQTDTLKKKLNVDTDTAHKIQDKVDRASTPVISYTIEAPTIEKAAENTADAINRNDPSLPKIVSKKTDRTMATPNTEKQKVDVYKITLRKPHKIKAGVLATSDHVYYGVGYQAGRWEGMVYTRTGHSVDAGTVTYTVKEW